MIYFDLMKRLLIALIASATAVSACSAPTMANSEPATFLDAVDWASQVSASPNSTFIASDCQESNISDRADAFRCFAESGDIYDPCFWETVGLICPDSPWSKVYALGVTDSNPPIEIKAEAVGLPWGIELVNGLQCSQMGGGTDAIGNLRMNYACDDDSTYLWGDPDRLNAAWTIQFTKGDSKKLQSVAIRRAIF